MICCCLLVYKSYVTIASILVIIMYSLFPYSYSILINYIKCYKLLVSTFNTLYLIAYLFSNNKLIANRCSVKTSKWINSGAEPAEQRLSMFWFAALVNYHSSLNCSIIINRYYVKVFYYFLAKYFHIILKSWNFNIVINYNCECFNL